MKKGRKYQKAVEYIYSVGMSVQYRLKGGDRKWQPAKRPSFLWELVEYRVDPADLKHEKKFAKHILRAYKRK